jgi:hypothetical protein
MPCAARRCRRAFVRALTAVGRNPLSSGRVSSGTPKTREESSLKITALALSAATLLGIVSLVPASAAPAPSSALKLNAAAGHVEQVQYKKYKKKGFKKGYRKGYRAGHSYRHAPKGWRSYSSRPYGWQTRGCIIVGPVWFCP